jgi:hypothetical protein
MKRFKVSLTRSYIVTIDAENEQQARKLSEFYLGDCPDLSASDDRKTGKFKIHEIEMTFNEAIEAREQGEDR